MTTSSPTHFGEWLRPHLDARFPKQRDSFCKSVEIDMTRLDNVLAGKSKVLTRSQCNKMAELLWPDRDDGTEPVWERLLRAKCPEACDYYEEKLAAAREEYQQKMGYAGKLTPHESSLIDTMREMSGRLAKEREALVLAIAESTPRSEPGWRAASHSRGDGSSTELAASMMRFLRAAQKLYDDRPKEMSDADKFSLIMARFTQLPIEWRLQSLLAFDSFNDAVMHAYITRHPKHRPPSE